MSIAESSPIRASERSSSTRAQRQRRGLREEAEVVGLQHPVEVEVLELGGDPRVEHLHHLVGGDAVGEHPGDEGAGAGADVDVEVVDGAVDREQVERAQGADLVDAAGEAAAAEHQSRLRGLFAAARFAAGLGLDVDDFAHEEHGLSQGGAGCGQAATLRRLVLEHDETSGDPAGGRLRGRPAACRQRPGSAVCDQMRAWLTRGGGAASGLLVVEAESGDVVCASGRRGPSARWPRT